MDEISMLLVDLQWPWEYTRKECKILYISREDGFNNFGRGVRKDHAHAFSFSPTPVDVENIF